MSRAKINDGGQAFPAPTGELAMAAAMAAVQGMDPGAECYERAYLIAKGKAAGGMTLRDYFAAAALQGICAAGQITHKDDVGRIAFERADAMLRARAAS